MHTVPFSFFPIQVETGLSLWHPSDFQDSAHFFWKLQVYLTGASQMGTKQNLRVQTGVFSVGWNWRGSLVECPLEGSCAEIGWGWGAGEEWCLCPWSPEDLILRHVSSIIFVGSTHLSHLPAVYHLCQDCWRWGDLREVAELYFSILLNVLGLPWFFFPSKP